MKVNNNPNYLTFILFVLINLSPAILFAQATSIQKGDRIRVLAPKYFNEPMKGTIIDIKSDSLFFQTAGSIFTLKLQDIKKLEVARGKQVNTKKGAIIGETGAIIGSGGHSPRWVEVPIKNLSIPEKEDVASQVTSQPVKATTQKKRNAVSGKPQWRWELDFTLGTTSSGPAGDIEKAMRRDGFDETLPGGWFGGPVEQPSSNTGFGQIGIPWAIQVNYHLSDKFALAMLFGSNAIGETDGYRSGPDIFLFLQYFSTIISPLIIYKPRGIFQLGAGPGLFINKIEDSREEIFYREQKSRPGMVFLGSLIYPQHTRFFIKLEVQYRWTPRVTYGPFKDTYRLTSLAQLQPFKADFSHVFGGLAIGFRL